MLIINTVFTGRGQIRPEWRDCQRQWIKERIEIFKNYTLKSLLNQTDRDFLHWISFKQKDKDNEDIKDLRIYLERLGYNFVFTFNGQPYWDDRGDNSDLKQRVGEDLAVLIPFIRENVYFTVLDSDDCFRKNAVKLIKSFNFQEKTALVMKNGYCLVRNELNEVYEWRPKTNPPFYTIMFPKYVFLDADKYIDYWREFKSHEDIPSIFKVKKLNDFLYLTIMHNLNRSTKHPKDGIHPYLGSKKVKKRKEILNNFGII